MSCKTEEIMDKKQSAKSPEDIRKQLVLTGADIVQLGASG